MVIIRLMGLYEHQGRFDPGTNVSYMPKLIYESLRRRNYAGISFIEENNFRVRLYSQDGNRLSVCARARVPCFFPHNDSVHILPFYIVDQGPNEIIIGNDNRYKMQDTNVKFFNRWKRRKEFEMQGFRSA